MSTYSAATMIRLGDTARMQWASEGPARLVLSSETTTPTLVMPSHIAMYSGRLRHQQADDIAFFKALAKCPSRILVGSFGEIVVGKTFLVGEKSRGASPSRAATSWITSGKMRSRLRAMGAVNSSARIQACAGELLVPIASSGPSLAHAVFPASTVSTVPVMFFDRSSNRNSTAFATSSISTRRFSALRRAICSPLLVRHSLSHVSVDETRSDRVHIHAHAANFPSKRAGKAYQRCLGCGVYREAAVTGGGGDRGYVHDSSTTIGHHRPDDILGEHDRRDRIQAHHLLYLRDRRESENAVGAHAGVVHQGVNRTEVLPQSLYQGPECFQCLRGPKGTK